MDVAVSVRNVSMILRGETVLKHVSAEFERERIHGIVGSNGSGKTVLFKCIAGFMCPNEGQIFCDYLQIGKDTDFPPDTGLIIETPGFLLDKSGYTNLKILASLRNTIGDKQIRSTLRRVDLDPDSRKPVGKYSLGMRQRLGIAQAIMENPWLLILDEPFNGLDKRGAEEMRSLLKTLRAEGKTILLASHNSTDIDELCDSVYEMDAGILTKIR